jgi:hypothetical protein
MACEPEVLKNVPLFALLDDDEVTVLASQVELRPSLLVSESIRPEIALRRPTC